MRIAVAAPTGHVGRQLVPMLIRAGVTPLVLLRDPGGLAPDIRSEVDVVEVDLLDGDAVVRAVSGVESLYWVDPPPVGDDPLGEYNLAAASAARAVTEGRVWDESLTTVLTRLAAAEWPLLLTGRNPERGSHPKNSDIVGLRTEYGDVVRTAPWLTHGKEYTQ